MTTIQRIVDWFEAQCDGEWEHGNGIVIQSMDNPGWWIKIELEDTDIEEKPFVSLSLERSKTDWVRASKLNHLFDVQCGPLNLEEALILFRDWAGS